MKFKNLKTIPHKKSPPAHKKKSSYVRTTQKVFQCGLHNVRTILIQFSLQKFLTTHFPLVNQTQGLP